MKIEIELTEEEIEVIKKQHNRDAALHLFKIYLLRYYNGDPATNKHKDHLRFIAGHTFPSFVKMDGIAQKLLNAINLKTP